MRQAVLIGVGVGPGDPELMTTRALRVLREADRVVAPVASVDTVGRAESIVREAAPDVRVQRLVFSMAGGDDARAVTHVAAAEALLPAIDAGERIAFITLGDPNVYSTFASLAAEVRRLRPATCIETVPGIMAFQDLAARTGTVVLDGTEQLALVTALDGPEGLDEVVADDDRAVVVYKGGRHLPAIAEVLERHGRLEGSVVGELLGLSGELVGAVADVADRPASYLATVIVPPARRDGRP